jgi:hypothetical protein
MCGQCDWAVGFLWEEDLLEGALHALAMIGFAVAGGELLAAAALVAARLPHPDDLSFAQGGALRRLRRAEHALVRR